MKIRTSKPEKGNKYYITKSKGGYSNAIVGSPTDKDCNVLANCVGYAYGRFNEIGGYGYCKYLAPVNAENFIQYKGSCKVGQTPKAGAVMVWQKGATLSGSDGAGHVAIVEKVISSTKVYTSESGWGSSTPFWNATRSKGSGNWGAGSGYKFLGFIYNPAVKDGETPVAPAKKSVETLAKEVLAGKWGNGDARKKALTNAGYNYSQVQAKVNELLSGKKTTTSSKKYHTVVRGDTLWSIAKKYYGNGSKYPTIAKANKISNPDKIKVGQKLLIP